MFTVPTDHILYYLGVTSALKVTLYLLWRDRKPAGVEMVGHVSELLLHPLKSAAAIRVQSIDCGALEGPHHGDVTDRHWALTSADYSLVNYKQEPKFILLTPEVSEGQLTLSYPQVEPLHVNIRDVTDAGKPVIASAYGTSVRGIDCGVAPADWLNKIFPGAGYRLLHCPPQFDSSRCVRTGNKKHEAWLKNAKDTDVIAYQSVTPYHVMTQDSLDDLNTRLSQSIGLERFRPNIVIRGPKAYDEDTWREMFIGHVRFSTTKLTGRCLFINIDPDSGETPSEEPLQVMTGYRKLVPSFGPVMGLHMVLERPGQIRIGDPVYVTRGTNTVKP